MVALFPEATFKVFLPEAGVIPGTRLEGKLQVDVPEPIPRAGQLELFYITRLSVESTAENGYEHDLFVASLKVRLDRVQPFPAGRFTYPFAIAIPAWLPPPYAGGGCTIRHIIEVRLAVEWAIDPTYIVTPTIVLLPGEAIANAISTRSPPGFHESLVIDLNLDTDTIEVGRSIKGRIALRGGHDARFTGLKIGLASMVHMRSERAPRRGLGVRQRISADELRGGASVPFKLRHPMELPPSFRTGIIEHDFAIIVQAEGTTHPQNPSFNVRVHVLPAGSTIHRGVAGTVPLGVERLGLLAAAMARATGLRQGSLPVLVEGKAGCVGIHVIDAPRAGRIGVDIVFELPDLGLGLALRSSDRAGGSSLLPAKLAETHILTLAPERPVADDALRVFFEAVLNRLETATELRFTDRLLALYFPLSGDGSEDVIACARWAKERAEILAAAISRLPFSPPFEASAPAWAAMAAEQSAYLLPHVPAIHGIKIGARIASGEQRELGVTLRTCADGTVTADLDLTSVPVPKDPNLDGLRAVRLVFPKIEIRAPERVSLEGAEFPAVPTLLLGTLETFLAWLLDVRGERRSDGPYR